uniref:KIB1-4 beta-propeller domain-containing protein n=1 Tax=Triticum aestivum TaxID=4565 RepID=A0A077RX31_WHEAT|nr:unnamed protein product [Triticum aestivum]
MIARLCCSLMSPHPNDLCFPVGLATETLLVRSVEGLILVFKADIELGKLVALDNINNYAIFMGHQRCLAVDADKFPGIEANCIYYTEQLGSSAHIFKCNNKDRKVERISEAAEKMVVDLLNDGKSSLVLLSTMNWVQGQNRLRLRAVLEQAPNDYALLPLRRRHLGSPFSGPPHYKRGFTFSCHGGWVFTNDEAGNPYLLNPITGAQAALPPVKTTYQSDAFYDDDGKHVYKPRKKRDVPWISWARHMEYTRVAMSTAADVRACTIVIVHMPMFKASFARPGDKRWTLLPELKNHVYDILDKDGLFYLLYFDGSVCTLDRNGPSPMVTTIMRGVTDRWEVVHNMHLVLMPSGELLQVWRNWEHMDTPLKYHKTYKKIVNHICHDGADLVGEDNNDKLNDELETNHEEDELPQVGADDQDEPTEAENNEDEDLSEANCKDHDIALSQLLREGVDMPHQLVDEVNTNEVLVFKVDIKRQKLLDIGYHALFLGLNAVVCVPTKDFPVFKPNCAYLTNEASLCNPMLQKDLGGTSRRGVCKTLAKPGRICLLGYIYRLQFGSRQDFSYWFSRSRATALGRG